MLNLKIFVFVLVFGILFLPLNAYASPSDCGVRARPTIHRVIRRPDEFKSDKLTSAVQLPGLPVYPGKAKFITGGVMPNVTGGNVYYMRFQCAENPTTTLEWYQEVFSQPGWVVDQAMLSKQTTAAVYNNAATCQIIAMPLVSSPYRTEVIVQYKFMHR